MQLGEFETNNIYNVDCYEAIKKLPDKSVDCIYTDVPYLIARGGCSDNDFSRRMKRLRDVDLGEIRDGIDYSILAEFVRVMKKVNIFIWCNKNQIYDIMNFFLTLPFKINSPEILVWKKDNPSPLCNNVWLPDLEYCLYFRETGVILNDGYEIKSKWYASPINKSGKDKFHHPTVKPLDLVERHLLHATQPEDIILDPFLGSGTTAVAAKNTSRRYIGFEINSEYYEIAQNRLNNIDANGQMSLFTF